MFGGTSKATSRGLLKILALSLVLAGIFCSPRLVAEPASHDSSGSGKSETPSGEGNVAEKEKAHAESLGKASDQGIKDIADQMKRGGVDSLSKEQLEKAFAHLDSEEGKSSFSEEDMKDLKDKITVAYEKFKTKTPDGQSDRKGDSAKSGDASKSPATSAATGADGGSAGDAGSSTAKPYLTLGSGIPNIGIPVVDSFVQSIAKGSRNLGLPNSPESRKSPLGNLSSNGSDKPLIPNAIKTENPNVTDLKGATPARTNGGGFLEAPLSSTPTVVSSQTIAPKVEALDSNFFVPKGSEANALAATETASLTPYASPAVPTLSPTQTSTVNPLRPLGATTNANTQLESRSASEGILGTEFSGESYNPLPIVSNGTNEGSGSNVTASPPREESIAVEESGTRLPTATGATLGAQASSLAVLSQNSEDKTPDYSEPRATAPDSAPAEASLDVASADTRVPKVPGVRGPDIGNMFSFANQVQ